MKRIKIFIISLFILLTVAIFYILLPEPEPLFWECDARQMYNIYTRTVMLASHQGIKSIYESLELKGILNFRVYEISEDIIKAGFQLYPVSIIKGSERDKYAEELYSKIFFVDISRNGEFLNFDFSNEIAIEDEIILGDIIRSFQLIIKDTVFSTWTVQEKNINGTYTADYDLERNVIIKEKKRYTEVRDPIEGIRTDEKIVIKNSGITFEYGKPDSWIKRAEGSELLVFYSKDDPYLKVSSIFRLDITPYVSDSNLAIWNDLKNKDEMLAEWRELPKNKISLARKGREDSLQDKFGNKSLPEVADGLFERYKAFDLQCIHALLEYLELRPEAATVFPDYLLSRRLNPTQQVMLVHALERAGDAEAQSALIRIMQGKDFTRESRTQAVVAFGSLGKPTGKAIDALWDAYENRGISKTDDHISATAVLSLGAMAKNLDNNSADDHYRQTSSSIKSRIISDLRANTDLNTKAALLHAAGNTADNKLLSEITPYFRDNNPMVRSAAVSSLVYMDDDKVNNILTEELMYEQNVNVRNTIVTTMYRKEASGESVKAIMTSLPLEDNDIVRGQMYRYLLKNRDFAGVKETLKRMLDIERSAEHRKIIYRALYTKKKASADAGS